MPLDALQSLSLNDDVPRGVDEVQPLQQEEQQSPMGMTQLPKELQWEILSKIESRADWRLVSREWNAMATEFWMKSSQFIIPIYEAKLKLYLIEPGRLVSASLYLVYPNSFGGVMRPFMRPLLQQQQTIEEQQINAYTSSDGTSVHVRGMHLVEHFLSVLVNCRIEAISIEWKRLPSKEVPSLPFDSLYMLGTDRDWYCLDLLGTMQESALKDLVVDYQKDPHRRLLWMASISKKMVIEVRDSELLRRQAEDETFAGIPSEHWAQLAAEIMGKGAVDLMLFSKDGSPFYDFPYYLLISHLNRNNVEYFGFCVTVPTPQNREDYEDGEVEGHRHYYRSSSAEGPHMNLFIVKIGLNLYNF